MSSQMSLKIIFSRNLLEHFWQPRGLSSLWYKRCLSRRWANPNVFGQTLHCNLTLWKVESLGFALKRRSWLSSFAASVVVVNGLVRPSCWISTCLVNPHFRLYILLGHNSHMKVSLSPRWAYCLWSTIFLRLTNEDVHRSHSNFIFSCLTLMWDRITPFSFEC